MRLLFFVTFFVGTNANSAALHYGNKCWVKRTFIYSNKIPTLFNCFFLFYCYNFNLNGVNSHFLHWFDTAGVDICPFGVFFSHFHHNAGFIFKRKPGLKCTLWKIGLGFKCTFWHNIDPWNWPNYLPKHKFWWFCCIYVCVHDVYMHVRTYLYV